MLEKASPLSYCKLLLLEENRRNLLVVVYALDDVGEDVRYGHHLEFAQVLFRVERYGVRDDHLLQVSCLTGWCSIRSPIATI